MSLVSPRKFPALNLLVFLVSSRRSYSWKVVVCWCWLCCGHFGGYWWLVLWGRFRYVTLFTVTLLPSATCWWNRALHHSTFYPASALFRNALCIYVKFWKKRQWWLGRMQTQTFHNGERAVAQMVEVLQYKPECRGFDSRWCHWNFFFDIITYKYLVQSGT